MKIKILLLLSLPLFFGCAEQQERAAKKQIERTCDSLVGCSEEEVLICLGVPQKIRKIAGLKVYQYHKSYGTRSNKNGYVTGSYSGLLGCGEEKTWETYDNIDIFFRDGYVTSWKCSVKR